MPNRPASPRRAPRGRPANRRGGRQSLRIIGGVWRGRRISFPELPGLRPTGDRIRETLFNWLQPWVLGEDCLDLFAGSGACGFEALSRGASSAVFVEAAREAADAIEENLQVLATAPGYQGRGRVARMRAEQWLLSQAGESRFGLVFVDPPFVEGDQTLLLECCHLLESRGMLKPHARIYLESGAPFVVSATDTSGAPTTAAPNALPANWRPLRQQRAGAVYFGLFERVAPGNRADSAA